MIIKVNDENIRLLIAGLELIKRRQQNQISAVKEQNLSCDASLTRIYQENISEADRLIDMLNLVPSVEKVTFQLQRP